MSQKIKLIKLLRDTFGTNMHLRDYVTVADEVMRLLDVGDLSDETGIRLDALKLAVHHRNELDGEKDIIAVADLYADYIRDGLKAKDLR